MEPIAILKLYGPLAALFGGAYAIVRTVFSYAWRFAQVEDKADRTEKRVDALAEPLNMVVASVIRIEERLLVGAEK